MSHISLIRYEILDLLVDGPSSVISLYRRLRGHPEYAAIDIANTLDELRALERRGLVRVRAVTSGGRRVAVSPGHWMVAKEEYATWLSRVALEDIDHDRVGYWFWIEEEGRKVWREWSAMHGVAERELWRVTQQCAQGKLVVHGRDLRVAEDALERWLKRNPGLRVIPDTRRVREIHHFTLGDGTEVRNGIELSCKYRDVKNAQAQE